MPPMYNVCGRGASLKYVMFSVMLSVLRFVLGVQDSEEVSLSRIIDEYNISSNSEILDLKFSNCKILESYFEKISGKLLEEDEELLGKYKRVVIKINNFVTTRGEDYIERRRHIFKKIVELIRPTELYIFWGAHLTNQNIRGIMLNKNMEIFRLSGSKITNMDELFGDWNKSLVEVDISCNELRSLPARLENVDSLRKLDISNNFDIFPNCRNCRNILDSEEIKRYKPLNKIKILYIHGTKLGYTFKGRELSNFLKLFPNVIDLDISENKLKLIPVGLKNLSNLKRLSIRGNPEIFKNWSSSEDSMKLKSITELDISKNRPDATDKKKLCRILKSFPNLNSLKICKNELSNIPISLEQQLQRLERLDISDNPDLFKNKSKEDISEFLSRFKNVKNLNISSNELSGTILIPMKNLKRLNISCNYELTEIKHTEDNLKLFTRLEELNVYSCRKLDIGFLKQLESVKYLNMMNVPLKDGCSQIYNFKSLKMLCIDKNKIKIDVEKLSSRSVKITDNYFDYRLKPVEEDREKESSMSSSICD